MSTGIDQLLGSFPVPGTANFEPQNRLAASMMEALCPVERRTTYYFSQSGSDANDGLSPASPKQTIGEMNTLLASSDVAVLLNGGDVWRTTTMIEAGTNSTVASYGTGKARITGFTQALPANSSVWTNALGDRWTTTDVSSFGWLLCESRGYGSVMEEVAGVAAVELTENSFLYSGGTLHVNAGFGVDPNTLDWAVSPGSGAERDGIELNGGSRAHNLLIDGQEMRSSTSQSYAVACAVSGDSVAVVTDCDMYYHSFHNFGQNVNSSGGRVLVRNCNWGWWYSEVSTGLVSYSLNGDNQLLAIDWTCHYGAVPRPGLDRRDYAIFTHTGTSGDPRIRYAASINGQIDGSAGSNSPARSVGISNAPDDGGTLANVRAISFKTYHGQHENASDSFIGSNQAWVSCRLYLKAEDTSNAALVTGLSGNGWLLSSYVDQDWSLMGNRHYGAYNTSISGVQPTIINSWIHVSAVSAFASSRRLQLVNYDLFSNAGSQGNVYPNAIAINSLFTTDADINADVFTGLNNGPACSHNATYRMDGGSSSVFTREHGNWSNHTELSAVPTMVEGIPDPAVAGLGDQAYADLPEVDLWGNALATPGADIGPVGERLLQSTLRAVLRTARRQALRSLTQQTRETLI